MDTVHFWDKLILFLFVAALAIICLVLSKRHQDQHRDIMWYRDQYRQLSQELRDAENKLKEQERNQK